MSAKQNSKAVALPESFALLSAKDQDFVLRCCGQLAESLTDKLPKGDSKAESKPTRARRNTSEPKADADSDATWKAGVRFTYCGKSGAASQHRIVRIEDGVAICRSLRKGATERPWKLTTLAAMLAPSPKGKATQKPGTIVIQATK